METALIKTLQVLLSLSILIILHEGGHFLFAKLFKVRVEKFYLFFDAWNFSLFKWPRKKKNEEQTEYGIGWLPLGGYVKISGMIDESMDKEQMKQPAKPWEFRSKPAWQRLLIMLGGVIVNFILAFFIYSMVLFTWGRSYVKPTDMTYGLKFNETAKNDGFRDGDIIVSTDGNNIESWSSTVLRNIANAKKATVLRSGSEVSIELPGDMNLIEMLKQEPTYAAPLIPMCIDSILPDSPAMQAGINKGDAITSINGNQIKDFNDFSFQLLVLQDVLTEESTHEDSLRQRTVTLCVNGTKNISTILTSDFKFGIINKMPEYKTTIKEYSFFEAIPAGIVYGCETLKGYVGDLKYVFTKEGSREVGGFIAIGNIFPEVWDWHSFWMLTAMLSIILGFMNVLPIPALDGGHALFTLYEIITGRKPSDKFLEYAQYAGMFILLGLLLWANGNDILRLFGI